LDGISGLVALVTWWGYQGTGFELTRFGAGILHNLIVTVSNSDVKTKRWRLGGKEESPRRPWEVAIMSLMVCCVPPHYHHKNNIPPIVLFVNPLKPIKKGPP